MTNKSEIRNGIQYKQCGTCKQLKPVSGGFYKMPHGNFGVTAECRDCSKKRAIKHRKAHPEYLVNRYKNDPGFREERKQSSREFKKKNPEYQKEWIEKHPDYQNIRYKNDPVYREIKKQISREWNRVHPEYQKEWIKDHPTYRRDAQLKFIKAHPDYFRKRREMKSI
ncbi:MAG: hypothetical protein NTV74_07905 [Euryarchaeota archaeon]|nr:hypothetical protein [Euryarchaeota archaeon]